MRFFVYKRSGQLVLRVARYMHKTRDRDAGSGVLLAFDKWAGAVPDNQLWLQNALMGRQVWVIYQA